MTPDREKVIKVICEGRIKAGEQGLNGVFFDFGFIDLLLDLLKEQEAIKPKKVKGYNPPMYTIYEYECEKCKSPMMNKQPFCMGCGKPVKWE